MSMKSDFDAKKRHQKACSPAVLMASPGSSLEFPGEQPGGLSLTSSSLTSSRQNDDKISDPSPRQRSLRLTKRRVDVIDQVFRLRVARHDHVHTALYTPGGASRCQRDLTLLVRHRYLDRLPRERVSDPAIYLLTRRSVLGNRLMRAKWGEARFRAQMARLGALEHLLAVNDVRVRVERTCTDLGWVLRLWQSPQELSPLLRSVRLVPDGYFQIQRQVDGQLRTAGFFLEVERAGKSSRVLRSKLVRYSELYYSRQYQQQFGTRALRLLVVFVAGGVGAPSTDHRIASAVAEAERLGVTIARVAGLEQLTHVPPNATLLDPIWRMPGLANPVALFQNAGES